MVAPAGEVKGSVAQWRFLAVTPDQFEWLFDRDAFLPADEKKLKTVLPPR